MTNSMNSPAATEEIARQALTYRYEDLPGEVVDWARLSLLDHCGLAIRGAREELTQILSNTFLGRGIAGTDMIPGALNGASLQDLAMLRASSAHAIDFDDTLLSAMGAGNATELVLPLSRRRKVLLRLRSSQPRQAIAAALLLPASPPSAPRSPSGPKTSSSGT